MKMYFKKNGKLTSKIVNLNSTNNGNVAKDLYRIGLHEIRHVLGADAKSPVMAIVK